LDPGLDDLIAIGIFFFFLLLALASVFHDVGLGGVTVVDDAGVFLGPQIN